MSETQFNGPTAWQSDAMQARIRARYRRERRFRFLGLFSILLAAAFLVTLIGSIAVKGWLGFVQTRVELRVQFDPAVIGVTAAQANTAEGRDAINRADYAALLRKAMMQRFPNVKSRSDRRRLFNLLSNGARFQLLDMVKDNPELIGQTKTLWFLASDDIDQFFKGKIDAETAEADRRVSNQEIAWVEVLKAEGQIKTAFARNFFTNGDSREPEMAGILGAMKGSLLTLLVTLAIAFPVGVAAAVYLEEFAPQNRWTDLIEVNINNLAAVPSIVFGLLGLAVFLNTFSLPRSAPLVGGLTLALMTLPTIIIASRAALKAVPGSIRAAAMGLGASRVQVVMHHVLPLSMPGVLTGAIIGMAQALGETAPLLMIGMVAFIVDVPGAFTDAATVLPVQIYLWADSPERAFVEKTSAAILVLLGFLVLMNALAVFLRSRFEKRW